MGHARSTTLACLLLAAVAWLLTGAADAWTLVGVPRDSIEQPAAERSTGRMPWGDRSPGEPRLLPVPSAPDDRSGDPSRHPFASPWRHLQGDLSRWERGLFADATDGRWDEHSLLGAALIASGTLDADALRRYEARFDEIVAELEEPGPLAGSPRGRAQALFERMHGRILTGGYQIDATDLTLALDRGRFNCVSASVLFNCLAKRFGLSARGLEIPGHAMSRLVLLDGPIDVETTCPDWFRLMDDPKKQAELLEKTIGTRLAAQSASAERREVSDVELVATIYYNRGVDLLAQKHFAEAAAANAKALRLDPSSTTARGNLLATINNWAVDAGSAGRYAEAVELLRRGIALDRGYETFQVNYVHVHSQWIEELCGEDRFREALDLIARAAQDPVDHGYFARARLDVSRRRARAHLETGRMEGSIRALSADY